MTTEELKKQKEDHTTKIFWLGLQIAFIFGVPAVAGALIGAKFDAAYGSGRKITSVILAAAFVFSWVWVIAKYRSLNKKLKELNQAIKKSEENKKLPAE